MKQPRGGALLSLPLLVSLLLAPPIALHDPLLTSQQRDAHRESLLSADRLHQERITGWQHTTVVDDGLRTTWLRNGVGRRRTGRGHRRTLSGAGSSDEDLDDDDDEEEEALASPLDLVPASPTSAVAKPLVPVIASAAPTPRALVLMLDYVHRVSATASPAQADAMLARLRTTLSTIPAPVLLPSTLLLAKPNALHALAHLFSASSRHAQLVRQVVLVPDAVVFELACLALDRSVTRHLLDTRAQAAQLDEGTQDPDACLYLLPTYATPLASSADAHTLLRMLRDFPDLLAYGQLAGAARREVQLAWFDQTRRDRRLAQRHALERWLFGDVMTPQRQRAALEAYAAAEVVVQAHGWTATVDAAAA